MKKIVVTLGVFLAIATFAAPEASYAAKSIGSTCTRCGAPGQTGGIRDIKSGKTVCDDCATKGGGKTWNERGGHWQAY